MTNNCTGLYIGTCVAFEKQTGSPLSVYYRVAHDWWIFHRDLAIVPRDFGPSY